MAGLDMQVFIRYGALGASALAAVQLVNNLMPTLLANQVLGYAVAGVSVGGVIAAGLGTYIVDQMLLK